MNFKLSQITREMTGIVQQGQVDRTVGALQRISMWSLSCHKAFWSSCAKTGRWIQGDSRSWCLYCCCAVAVADRSIFVSVSTLTRHDRDSGSAVNSGTTMWLAGTDRSWGFMSQSAACGHVCVCTVLWKRTWGYYLPNITIAGLFARALHISMTCCDLTQPTGIWI